MFGNKINFSRKPIALSLLAGTLLITTLLWLLFQDKSYSDKNIRDHFAIKEHLISGRHTLDVPFLDVVPAGKTMKISTIFDALSINHAKIGQVNAKTIHHVTFYEWPLSPSYAISIMTANNGVERNTDADIMNLHGYGVRIVKIRP